MDSLDFSEEEIQEQLNLLGYKNIPRQRLLEFKRDLDELIRRGSWRSPTPSPPAARPSPPAVTKEILGRRGAGFFLHQTPGDQEIQAEPRSLDGRFSSRVQPDPYASHSVVLGGPRAAPDPETRRLVRRKVLRKHGGRSLVCDESFYSTDSECTPIDLHERLDDLHLSAGQDSQSDSESDGAGETLSGGSLSSASDVGHMTRSRSDGDLRSRPSSFIRAAPSRRGPKKTDPVAMYFQYKQLWEMFKAPGEEDHRELRRRIRERLAQQPPPFRRSRAALPGSYVVPTEKKRSALRWRIRSKMAAAPRDHNNFYCSF